MAGKRGSYNCRQSEILKNADNDRESLSESHERWTARKVTTACNRFLIERRKVSKPAGSAFGDGGAKWLSRGEQPPVVSDITNPLSRVAAVCRRIRETFDDDEREQLEREFRMIEDDHCKADAVTGFALPGELTPRHQRLAMLFPNPSAHYAIKQLLRNADITLTAWREWKVELGSAITARTIKGRLLYSIATTTPPSTSAVRSRRKCSKPFTGNA
jgi:hypothetical protein